MSVDAAAGTTRLPGRAPPAPAAPVARVGVREVGLLGAVLVLALVLRVIGLDSGLWYDEALTLARFVRAPVAVVVTDLSSFNNHILYTLQAKAATALFGEHPWALRLPALLFGLGSIGAVWLLVRRIAGPAPGLLAAFFLAISSHHVWFSQNARGYTEMLFWTTLGTWCFIAGLRRPQWRVWTGYAACVIAGTYTHLSTALFFAAHLLVHGLLWARPPHRRDGLPGLADRRSLLGYALAGIGTAVLYVPLVVQLAATTRRVGRAPGTGALAEWRSPWRVLEELVRSADALGPGAALAVLLAAAALAYGARALWRREPLLVAVYAAHVLLVVVVIPLLSLRLWPRYFFVDAGLAVACAAMALWQLAGRAGAGRRRVATAAALSACIAVVAGLMLVRVYAHPKQDLAGAVRLVEAQRAPADVATSVGIGAEAMQRYFAPAWPAADGATLRAWLAANRRIWLVMAFPAANTRGLPDVTELLRTRFELVAALPGTLGDGEVRIYRSR